MYYILLMFLNLYQNLTVEVNEMSLKFVMFYCIAKP
jgi:hypothetical protein